jgi:phospholipid/cholesterol/gamma-HCH transport system substrate-binding protein/paraquat-inducible protein B
MDDKQQYFRLGMFVVASVAILFGVLFILGGKTLFQPKLEVETYFNESVAGVDIGVPVKARGVQVGQVTMVDFSSTLYERDVPVGKRRTYIVVRATIVGARAQMWRKELEAYVQRGLRVRTQLAGITGQQYLAVDFVDPKAYPPLPFDWKPEYSYVPSAPSFTSEIIMSVQNLVSNLDKADIEHLGQNLNALVVNLNKKLDQLPVAELSADAAGVLRDARATINHVERVIAQTPIDETVRNLSSASARLDTLLADPALGQTISNASVITARLRKVAETGEIDRIAKNLDGTVQRVEALLGDNQYDVRGVIQDLRVTAANLRTLSETAKHYPPGLLVGGPPKRVDLPNDLKPNNAKKEPK